MWKAEYVMTTDVTPAALYRTITDINNWSEWDTGLEYTRLDGDVKPGAAVYARPHQDRIGTFAEFIAMNEADVALKPKNLTMEEAASIPLVGLTAWQVLIERANLKQGHKVLIHAGSGGVGTFAIQL